MVGIGTVVEHEVPVGLHRGVITGWLAALIHPADLMLAAAFARACHR